MSIAMIAITGFQVYWLKDNYDREKQSLDLKTSTAFRQTILSLQSFKLKLDDLQFRFDSTFPVRTPGIAVTKTAENPKRIGIRKRQPEITVINLLQEKINDSLASDSSRYLITYDQKFTLTESDTFTRTRMPSQRLTRVFDPATGKFREENDPDSALALIGKIPLGNKDLGKGRVMMHTFPDSGREDVIRFLHKIDSLSKNDTISNRELYQAYKENLKAQGITIPFTIYKLDSTQQAGTDDVTIGFIKPVTYRLSIQNSFSYILKELSLPILFSFFLVGISIASFILLYRGLVRQQKLIQLKNDFVSNVTHELKTPIATMGVAIEALKNFNALNDTKKTKEYLDISQNELQRLSMLVDKVLKLSMFGSREMELKFEQVSLDEIVQQVLLSMRLQLEKVDAEIMFDKKGAVNIPGDRLHLLSVVYNLLDNSLKYTSEKPVIKISLEELDSSVVLKISDNGIGIPKEYTHRVFEKFFRVPAGNLHNSKGYGLGLSYAFEVIKKHKGIIRVESGLNAGATFIISLPKTRK